MGKPKRCIYGSVRGAGKERRRRGRPKGGVAERGRRRDRGGGARPAHVRGTPHLSEVLLGLARGREKERREKWAAGPRRKKQGKKTGLAPAHGRGWDSGSAGPIRLLLQFNCLL